MNVIGFCGFSGSGKTTLVEQLIGRMSRAGQRVSVVKHAHHEFDIDHEGKDSWRHRQAGAFEVVIASSRRLAKMREFVERGDPSVHQLIAELAPCDWVLVEGFKRAALPKIEIWRAATGKPIQYADDPHVVAVATDSPDRLPVRTDLPLLDLNDADAIAGFLLADPARYAYRPPIGRPEGAAGAVHGVSQVDAVAWLDGVPAPVQEFVADEVAVSLVVNGRVEADLFATPADLDDLAVGYLLGAGIVDSARSVLAVQAAVGDQGIAVRIELAPTGEQPRPARGRALSPAGVSWAIDPAALARGMRSLAAGRDLRRATGATHAAAWLSLDGELLTMREDVGRHNALDKLIGAMARSETPPEHGFVAVTSRASFEIVAKVAGAGIGLLAVMSAPTALAIRTAEEAGLTLAGFARGGNATIYTHPARVSNGPLGNPKSLKIS